MKVVIIGGPGTAVSVADQMTDAHERFGVDIEVLGLALDDHSHGDVICGYPILCGVREVSEKFGRQDDVKVAFLLYRPDAIAERVTLFESLGLPQDKICGFIHPSALVARSARLGVGNLVLANSVVNSNATLGNFNVVNVGVLIGHDTVVGDHNFFAAHSCIGSNMQISNRNFFGLKCTVRNGCVVGDDNIVGMAANVVKDVGNSSLLYGNPATVKTKLNHKMG